MDRPVVTGDIVATRLKRGEGRSTLCFCVNRRHAQHVAECFIESGVAAEYMDGTTVREDRGAIFDRFRSGETRVICNVGLLTTGVDLDVRASAWRGRPRVASCSSRRSAAARRRRKRRFSPAEPISPDLSWE
jgi:hypothetical protein